MPESPLLDLSTSASYLGVSDNFMRRVVRYEIPVVQHLPRGPLYFKRVDLDMWIARNTRVPAR